MKAAWNLLWQTGLELSHEKNAARLAGISAEESETSI